MFQNFDPLTFVLAILPVLMAITVHEAAHAYAARYWGDRTAEQLGRLTLNPLAHIDLVGTVIVPVVMFLLTPFIFGWAKPVPIVTRNFRNTRLGLRTVAIAGPLSNLVMAFGWGLVMALSLNLSDASSSREILFQMGHYGVLINTVMFVLNMLPIPPLDGGRFVDSFLNARLSMQYQRIEPYGTWIILLLLISGLLGSIMQPFIRLVLTAVQYFASLFI